MAYIETTETFVMSHMDRTGSASDIVRDHWIDRYAPRPLRPYLTLARMDRPIGTWLLVLPCWWGVTLASDGPPDGALLVLFAIGALVMRGAGCTINDIVDRDIDARVARTAGRPIPRGDVSVVQAFAFLGIQLGIGLVIVLQLNTYTIWLAISSLGLVVLYPFAKRVTYWPQLVLGLTFNWGALVGWASVRGQLDWPAVALYTGGVFWTLGYDTIYAHQDKKDDLEAGVKSSALALQDRTRTWLFVFYGLTILLFSAAGYFLNASPVFFAGVIVCSAHLLWQVGSVDIDDPRNCSAKFRSNRDFGLAMLVVFMVETVLR